MKPSKTILLTFIIVLNTVFFSGCWNYREIDQLAIVAGVAIDEGTEKKYKLTLEVVYVGGGIDSKVSSRIITIEGNTMFDAARNAISVTGKKLYWSHSKVVIVSKEIARKGLAKVIDWFIRDSETRSDVYILVAGGDTAQEIFEGAPLTEEIISYELEEMLLNYNNLSKAPMTKIWEFANYLADEGVSPIAPVIYTDIEEGRETPTIVGTAIFKEDKLIGFIDGDETKYLLLALNQVKGGVITYNGGEKGEEVIISLEILKSKTKNKPAMNGNNVELNIELNITTAIDDVERAEDNLMNDEIWKRIEREVGKMLENNIKETITKIQQQYNSDIFGFGRRLHKDKLKIWNLKADNWNTEFKELNINVNADVYIKNSALLSKPLEVRD